VLPIHPQEGLLYNGPVATFTNSAGGPTSNYAASIDWGDGSPTTAGTITLSGSTFTVSGSHRYGEEGARSLHVRVALNGGNTTMAGTPIVVTDQAPVVSALPITSQEGSPFTGGVATFTDPGGAETAGNYTASIDWGDGSTSSGMITLSSSTFTVSGSHTYREQSNATLRVTVTDDGGLSGVSTWTTKPGMPTARFGPAAAPGPDGLIYAFGGFLGDSARTVVSTVEAFNPATNSWTTKASMPTARGALAAAPGADGQIYVFGGFVTSSNSTLSTVEAYNLATNSWTSKHSMPTARESLAAALGADGQIYVFGGYSTISHNTLATVEAYNPATDTWTTKTSMPTANDSMAAVAGADGLIYVCGGSSGSTVEAYNPATNSWSAKASMSTAGASLAAGPGTDGLLYVIGGGDSTLEAYNPATDSWSTKANVPNGIPVEAAAPGADGLLYAISFTIDFSGRHPTLEAYHPAGQSGLDTGSATVSDPPVMASGGFTVTAAKTVASGLQTVATFTDPGGAEGTADYGASINWGDGSATSSGTISLSGSTFTVQGNHTYTQASGPAHDGSQPDTITVTLSHESAPTATAHSSATVTNTLPVLPTGGFSVTAVEGIVSGLQTVATFTDPAGPDLVGYYGASINWGDGSATSAGTISLSGSTFTVQGSHTYTEESAAEHTSSQPYTISVTTYTEESSAEHTGSQPYTISVTISHLTAPTATASSSATVSDPAVQATAATGPFSATEGQSSAVQCLVTFTDPGGPEALSDYSIQVDWGEGNGFVSDANVMISGPVGGVFTVSGCHRYTDEDNVGSAVKVKILHEGTTSNTVNVSLQLSDPAVQASGGFTVTAAEGTASGLQTVATFTDPGGPESVGDYSASINWGDSSATTAGIITFSGGTFTVSGSHTYAEEGPYPISVTLSHEATATQMVQASAQVSDPQVVGTPGTVHAVAGGPFAGAVLTFTDPGGPEPLGSAYAASLNWGDGSPTTAGSITFDGVSTYTVSGSHTYAAANSYAISWTISHEGVSTTGQSTATVTNLGLGVQVGQSASIYFWAGMRGQALINSFNGGSSATGLANWLALTFPDMYGVSASTHNLFGKSNTQVAAFYLTLYPSMADADVLATALNVYASTQSLGGTAAQAYGFTVTAYGLGADAVSVGGCGAAFGVPNLTTLNVYELLLAVNQRAVGGVLYNGDMYLRTQAQLIFDALNVAGGVG
jgi:hypothetical protein